MLNTLLRRALRLVIAPLATIALAACSNESTSFRIEGRFQNFNRGEIYVYSLEAATPGRDTITVFDGRFSYETSVNGPTTFMLVFPNYTEHVVFARGGAVARVKADASHLREMKVSGTKENSLMTDFRMHTSQMTPPEVRQAAIEFVREHPSSPVSAFLVRRYLVIAPDPDYATARDLLELLLANDPDNGRLKLLLNQVGELSQSAVGAVLPDFHAPTLGGDTIARDSLRAKVNIVAAWATWSNTSLDMMRHLRDIAKQRGRDVSLVAISLDVNEADCRKRIARDSIACPVVCDGLMWDSPLIHQLGIAAIPTLIVADQSGKIVARDLDNNRTRELVGRMLD